MDVRLKIVFFLLRILVILASTLVGVHTLPDGVEHVFFRSKADIHTTRSQWLVGLVIDFDMYQNYLEYLNGVIEDITEINNMAQLYFQKLRTVESYRTSMFHNSGAKKDDRTNLKVRYYHQIFIAQSNEFKALQELHNKNWVDFAELDIAN